VSYQLRTNYLSTVADGVGERLITINDSFLNTAGFKAAGWRANPTNIRRTHSPPIPTAIASEYFQAPPRSAGLTLDEEVEEGGMVTGGGAGDTIGPAIATKRRRRREQMEEEDSSDLSDESDEEGDQRAAQQIKFSKMPIRNRSGSSPLRGSNLRQSSTITSPVRTNAPGTRRGSHSALEAVKERARRDTVTSSEMSSDNEFDATAFQRQREAAKNAPKATKALQNQTSDLSPGITRQQSDLLEEEEEEDSDGSDTSSAFAGSIDSVSLLESADGAPMVVGTPAEHIVGTLPKELTRTATKKSRPAPAVLQALPPPRPISMLQPKSLLSAAINAKRTKAAMPFESFASLSGQGDPNPLSLRIWAPFATSSTEPFEVLIRRSVHENESNDRQVTVADLIGLSLWRYSEEKLQPTISEGKLNVNRWTLRLVEDEEVDYDFPALDRTKPVVSFTTVNNRAARSRSKVKPYDEFGLVEATEEQFKENQALTPQFKQEATASAGGDDFMPIKNTLSQQSTLAKNQGTQPRLNPLLTTMTPFRYNTSFADSPAIGSATTSTTARTGVKKLLRVTIASTDAKPGQMITLEVTTDTYLADVLDILCRKRQLDKANHVLKLSHGTVVLLDRTVESIGNQTDLFLYRRRFATDGPLTMTGSPSNSSPKMLMSDKPDFKKIRKGQMLGVHPLAQEAIKQDELGGSSNYRKYVVWRKQPMRFVGMNERIIAIDGEYLHIMPSPIAKAGTTKTTTVHFSNVVGCKVMRRHNTTFKVSTSFCHCIASES
jgi:hypothetical protein